MSYNGGINFGLLADYDSMEDVGYIARGIEDALQELLDAAKDAEPEKASKRTAEASTS